jgi:hypothetical protein
LSNQTTAFNAVEGAKPYPPDFRARKISANGVPLYVRVGRAGPAVVLLSYAAIAQTDVTVATIPEKTFFYCVSETPDFVL